MASRTGPLAGILIIGIRIYQKTLANLIGGQCRFHPSCSEYGIESLRRYGAIKGSILTVRRIGRCHPWGGSGHDPVP
ncbi:MAG: membrane protein insertion efficiency factor YidD [Planctomycetota bacterium]|nr:membrane protein insertion efficiency factor YidD [Planctomycetota bacterium]MEC8560941.1 membrane protein insertion efficiency factor YidD [Planctomycetota bacterium]MEC8735076.1 membrane protein insertion efficiency factor YidD [Planctomycetota bacterium]MEC9158443.1 membrane protein insertion efficiency factor YidD [Planctomycetota bacterium]MEC9234016.1 membrane protein insertion efficiency factor YidD [Planctomycetota bacterium]